MSSIRKGFLVFSLALVLLSYHFHNAAAQEPLPTSTEAPGTRLLTADELLQMVNQGRLQIGHPALVLDPILMSYTQGEADLAANSMPPQGSGPPADVIAMGYGYPETSDTIFCTYHYAQLDLKGATPPIPDFGSPDVRAVNNVYYRHVGFGVSKGTGDWDGYVFYLMLACYDADKKYHPGQATLTPGASTPAAVSEVIIPVRTAQAQNNGQIVHEVLSGQSLWAIAMAYHTHIQDILTLNHLAPDTDSVYQGQKLLIPTQADGPTRHTATAAVFTMTPGRQPPTRTLATAVEITAAVPESTNTLTPGGTQTAAIKMTNGTVAVGIVLLGVMVFVLASVFKK